LIATFLPIATFVLSLAVGCVALAQWRVARNKLRLDLFDRRYKVYEATQTFLHLRCYRHYIDELRGQRRRRTNRINPIYAGLVMALVLATSVYAECSISCEFLQRIRIRDVSEHGAGIPGGLQGWQKPSDFPQVAPNKIVWLKSATDVGSVVMGNGHGYLTASCNLKDICLKLAQTASEHHANAIATQTVKGEVIVQFLRVNEHVFIQKTNGL
jgi:hypothetical protein